MPFKSPLHVAMTLPSPAETFQECKNDVRVMYVVHHSGCDSVKYGKDSTPVLHTILHVHI